MDPFLQKIEGDLQARIAAIKDLVDKKVQNQIRIAQESRQNNRPVKTSQSKISGVKMPIVDTIGAQWKWAKYFDKTYRNVIENVSLLDV